MMENDCCYTIIIEHINKKHTYTVSIIVNQQNRLCLIMYRLPFKAPQKDVGGGLPLSLPFVAPGLPGLVRADAEVLHAIEKSRVR